MRVTVSLVVLIAWLVGWVVWAIGQVGRPLDSTAGVFGWGHVLVMAAVVFPTALLGHLSGRNSK